MLLSFYIPLLPGRAHNKKTSYSVGVFQEIDFHTQDTWVGGLSIQVAMYSNHKDV